MGVTSHGRNYRLLVAGLAVPQITSVLIVAVTAFALGPSGRGEIAFAQATATTIAVVGGWGFYLSAAASGQSLIPRQYFDLTLGFTAALSAGVVIVAVLAPRGLLVVPGALLIGFAAVMTAGTTYCQRLAQARASDFEYLVIGSVPPLVSLVTIVPALLLGCAPSTVVAVWALSTSIGFAAAVYRTRRAVATRRESSRGLVFYVRSSLAVGAANVSSFLALRGDTVILGIASTAVQVGYYSVSVAMAGLLLYVSEAFSLRTISRYVPGQSPGPFVEESFGRAWKAAGLAALLSIPFMIGGWGVLHFVFAEFEPAFPAFLVLCLAAIPTSFVRVLVSAASMVGLRRLLSWYSALCFGLLAIYLPVAPGGATWLAVASLVIYSLQAVFVAIGLRMAQANIAGDA